MVQQPPIRIVVTGASGSIGYSALFRIARGDMLGQVPIHLTCLELPSAMKNLEGIGMELKDCAFPLLQGLTLTDDPKVAFQGAEFALLIGAKPRKPGMERVELLKENAAIFSAQGKALNDFANPKVRVLVVGNPVNTNAMITWAHAPKLNPRQITAMTLLDHNRGLAQLAEKLNCKVTDIDDFAVWGNHSASIHPDVSQMKVKGVWAKDLIDQKWKVDTFIPKVQKRGAEILGIRGTSSAASAASAAIQHMRTWVEGTGNSWTSFATRSEGTYGVDEGLWFSFPTLVTEEGDYRVIGNLPLDPFTSERLEINRKELLAERDMIKDLLKGTQAAVDAPKGEVRQVMVWN